MNAPPANSRSSALGLQLVGGDLRGLVDHLVAGHGDGDAADGQRARPVGVEAERGDRRVAVQHVDVVGADAELVGDDHRPRRLVALAVRRGAGDDLHLGRRQHPHRRRLPAAGRVVQRGEHPRRGQAAHLEVRRHADAEALGGAVDVLRRAGGRAARRSRRARPPWSAAASWSPESYTRPLHAVYGNASLAMKLRRRSSSGSMPTFGGQRVHRPLDGVRGLGAAGAAVGVGGRHRREHRRALEVVGRGQVVHAGVQERAEQRDARRDELEVGAHVGEQADPDAR